MLLCQTLAIFLKDLQLPKATLIMKFGKLSSVMQKWISLSFNLVTLLSCSTYEFFKGSYNIYFTQLPIFTFFTVYLHKCLSNGNILICIENENVHTSKICTYVYAYS